MNTPFGNCVTISVLPDDRVENDETLMVKLLVSSMDVTVARDVTLITIIDNDGECIILPDCVRTKLQGYSSS